MRTPLALKNLLHDRRRLLLALAGVGFAVLLMCMQLGFQNALFDSTVALIRQLNADLIITSQAHYTLIVKEPFTRRRLYQASATAGVRHAWPLYLETVRSEWHARDTHQDHRIRVLAFDPALPVLLSAEVREQAAELTRQNTVLFDSMSKPEYGQVRMGGLADLAGQEVRVAGFFRLGTDFAYDGNVVTSDLTFRRLFPRPASDVDPLGMVDVGLIELDDGADVVAVQQKITGELPDDVKVMTRDEFEAQELGFWRRSTPIGYIFRFGALMGFVVGVIICYQILYADITDHLAEYATLKAMGYRSRYFVGVVMQEALWLSVLGFLPGIAVSGACYAWLRMRTGLPLELTFTVAGSVLAMTIGMCLASACLSIRKVLAADPAELFR